MKIDLVKKFDRLSEWIADNLGKPLAFALALLSIMVWDCFGPVTHYSDTWQLIVNTTTTIMTFLMVFLLQNTQNRDTLENHTMLREIRDQQRLILNNQRRMAEKIKSMELHLDKNSG